MVIAPRTASPLSGKVVVVKRNHPLCVIKGIERDIPYIVQAFLAERQEVMVKEFDKCFGEDDAGTVLLPSEMVEVGKFGDIDECHCKGHLSAKEHLEV